MRFLLFLALLASAAASPLVAPSQSLPAATVGSSYAKGFQASGGTPPYVWTLSSGAFPQGMVFANGRLSGPPTQAGHFKFGLTVTDAASGTASVAFELLVNAAPAGASTPAATPLSVPYPGIDGGTVGVAYTHSFYATGGTLPYVWTVSSGTPPPGLTVANGKLSGTPTKGGDYKFQVKVTDAASATAVDDLDLYVGGGSSSGSGSGSGTGSGSGGTPATPLAIPYPGIDGGTIGVAYTHAFYATGGTPPYVWTVSSGVPPPGLIVANAKLSGTPTQGGDYKFQVKVTDAASATVVDDLDVWIGGGSSSGSGGGGGGGIAPPPAAQYTLTVVNGTLNNSAAATGSFAAATVVTITAGAAPAGQAFKNWTGGAVLDANSPSTTITIPAGNVTVTANFFVPPPIPQPVTGHPRLWITPQDLPRLRSWAVASNPVYQSGMVPLLNAAIGAYNQFFPGGTASPGDVPNVNWPDPGDTQGYVGLLTEQYAMLFALHSLIDPNAAARIKHAQRARNLIMVAMNQAVQGPLTGAPFRDPLFAVYNRANFTAEAWGLSVDWIYNATDGLGNPILTAQDKATIQKVFLLWASACVNASTTGGDHPSPVGAANSPSLLPGGNAYRMASNNYYLGHARLITIMALALDPADDPAVNPLLPLSAFGNSIRSYISNATGAWLFQEYAMMGDPANVRADYNLNPNASVGLASGGLPPEGMLYGHSFGFILGQLLALKTAGFADPAISGPQAALANAPVWDRFMKGFTSSLEPAAQVQPGYGYMGPVFQMASYGDILRIWVTPDFAQPIALLSMLDQQNGDASRLNAERWFLINALEGGAANLLNRIQSPYSYGVQDALLAFLVLDPNAPPATDPRPGWPTAFYDAPQGRLVEHTDWTPSASMFTFHSSWISINHQQADANNFDFYRKGEWLTKNVANYDNNIAGLTTDYHNTLSLKNWCINGTPTNLGWWEPLFWTAGSQWQLGGAAGDPTVLTAVAASYTYAYGDTTNLYNKPSFWQPANAAADILHASRSILWLKPDHIVVYDRATSKTAGLFKRFNLALTTAPSVSGNLISNTTPGGQHLYVSSLLPAGASVTTSAIGNVLNPMAQTEPSRYRVVIEDPSLPTDVRFLNVLQGADAGSPPDTAALVQSSAGTPFDGALYLDTVVMFKRDMTTGFSSLTFTVPSTTAHFYVAGLAVNAAYSVSQQATPQGILVTVTPGAGSMSDSAGVLSF